MKRLIIVQLVSLVFSLSAVPAAAQQYSELRPCQSRGKRVVNGLAGGGMLGAIVGGLWKGNRKAMAWGAGIGAGAGAASGFPNQPGCARVRDSERENYNREPRRGRHQASREPYPSHITPADERQENDSADMPTVYIRNLSGGNQSILVGLLGPAMDKNGYAILDRQSRGNDYYGGRQRETDTVTAPDYVVDVTLQEIQQSYGNSNANYYGRDWGFNVNPNGGKAKFIVNVTTYHNGRYARELSATGLPETITLRGGYADVRVKGFNLGHNGETYSVDPYTMAAYQAIAETFGLNR